MTKRFDYEISLVLDEKVQSEIALRLGGNLNKLWITRHQLAIIEENFAKYAVAVNMAASKPASHRNFLVDQNAEQWHKDVDLMDDTFLCHRPMVAGAEFAIIRTFPKRHEICHRAWNAVEVLHGFVNTQRKEMVTLMETVAGELKQVLLQKCSAPVAEFFVKEIIQQFAPDQMVNNLDLPSASFQTQSFAHGYAAMEANGNGWEARHGNEPGNEHQREYRNQP